MGGGRPSRKCDNNPPAQHYIKIIKMRARKCSKHTTHRNEIPNDIRPP